MKTYTHEPESMPRQYIRIGVMLVFVGAVVATGILIEQAERLCKWGWRWWQELKPGERMYP